MNSNGVGLKTPLELYRDYKRLAAEFMKTMGAKRPASVDDATNYFFYIDRSNVHFDNTKKFVPNSDDEANYSSEIVGNEILRKDDLVMILVRSCFGDGDYYLLFSADKEIKDE